MSQQQQQQGTMVSAPDLVSDLKNTWTEIKAVIERGQTPSGSQVSQFDRIVAGLYEQLNGQQ